MGLQLEEIIENGKEKLEILLNDPTASLTQIGTVLAEIANRTEEVETSDRYTHELRAHDEGSGEELGHHLMIGCVHGYQLPLGPAHEHCSFLARARRA